MKSVSLVAYLVSAGSCLFAVEKPAAFMEPDFPFYQTQVDLMQKSGPMAENFVTRGIVIPIGTEYALAFDQDLLRVAGLWKVPAGKPLVTLANMAQGSYAEPHRKSGAEHSKPTGPTILALGLRPGMGLSADAVAKDPRKPNASGDLGRGPLPIELGRFEGVEVAGKSAILRYTVAGTAVREWHEVQQNAGGAVLLRHLAFEAQPQPLCLSLGAGNWTLKSPKVAESQPAVGEPSVAVVSNSDALTFEARPDGLIAKLAAGPRGQRITIAFSLTGPAALGSLSKTPEPPAMTATRRWPQTVTTKGKNDDVRANGLALDRIDLPETNPWNRRIRPADISFLTADRAAVLTFDGDVWIADGLNDAALSQVRWQRFASGLHEALAMAVVNGAIQVATKNGIARLHDRDGNGEADWYENFSDAARQSQTTRSFPLDMDIGPDGFTYVSAGGIALGGKGTPFGGGIARISPDGKTAELFSSAAREPYVTVHPRTGLVTGTDQQGQFIPSSVCYVIRQGDQFGFGDEKPAKLTQPLVWIPHTEDNSCASQVWLTGEKFGPFREQLLHLSYGNGGLFLISPDLEAPTPQGAVIPLGFDTKMPLLQGRMHPSGSSVFLAGFQIYDSRTPNLWALGRLRPSGSPLTTAINAQSCAEGVILRFSDPLQPDSVRAEDITARSWNYRRSKDYGSGRFQRDGVAGMDSIGVSQAVLSEDRRSVFIHMPGLAPAMQLEVRHAFKTQAGVSAEGAVYFTIHQARRLDLAAAGFSSVDLKKTAIVSRQEASTEPTVEMGRALSVNMGCAACHSTDGTAEGKTGPSWKGLFGIDRVFADGSVESANEFYIRDSILNPMKKVVKGYAPGMASYKGVLTAAQIDALILYIKTLK